MLERVKELQEEREIVESVKQTIDSKIKELKEENDPLNDLAIEAFENIAFKMEIEIYNIGEEIADILIDKQSYEGLYIN